MDLPAWKRNYFSIIPERERGLRRICWLLMLVLTAALYLFWGPLRSTRVTYFLVSLTLANTGIHYFFRFFSMLGSEGFFLAFLSVIYWCVNKSLGFWGLVVMPLSIFITSEIPKDIIRLPRPDIRGVSFPTYTFPSGHTSGAVSVWGYLSARVQKRWLSAVSLVIIIMVGLSRVMLGYHFPGDVLGGIITGTAFTASFFWLVNVFLEKGTVEKLTFPILMVLCLAVPLAMSYIPASFASRLMGYLAGSAAGCVLERKKLGYPTDAVWRKQLVKVLTGLGTLALILPVLSLLLPAGNHLLTFSQSAFATLWITYLAPLLFLKAGLACR